MNTLIEVSRRLGLAAWCAAVLAPALSVSAASASPAPQIDESKTLHVMVDIPVAIRPMQPSPWTEEDFARVLGGYLRDEFRKAGCRGEIVVHERWADLPGQTQRLEVSLLRWNRNRDGSLECTLTAELVTPDGTRAASGLVSETQLEWSRSPHGLADALEAVARKAMKELHRRFRPIAETQQTRK